MLKLKNIVKNYVMGDAVVGALKGVDVEFRENEFVSVLGPSGCGKTTLLNIVGGLDRYTDGDLIINGTSTKLFKSGDWDAYRNHKIGFVFQSYNLIPHQTVLSNVELALTLSGVSKSERRRRAKEVLEKVGLGDQLKKKPNQMSGGQMQRVAIARALVNDPDIILADEPTGALDTETSVQIMEILKEVSKNKLIIMVTHNPELAETYSSRIIKLVDGKIVDDSAPYTAEEQVEEEKATSKKKKEKKPSMKLHTALSLSLNNLMTKKARTFLTSFAGSIGIIGIALILSVSNGVQSFIDLKQEEALSSFPITIMSEERDLGSLMSSMQSTMDGEVDHELDAVYSNDVMYELFNKLINSDVKTNNLKAFKKYLEDNNILANDYISAIQYGYGFSPAVYTKDVNGKIIKSDAMELLTEMMGESGQGMTTFSAETGGFNVWQEMLHGEGNESVSNLVKDRYELIHGNWPTGANEIVLIVDKNNELSDMVLYSLGLKTKEEIMQIMQAAYKGEEIDIKEARHTYEELLKMSFKVVLPGNYYRYDEATNTYVDLRETESGLRYLYDNGFDIKISGIIRSEDDGASMMSGSIGYTKELTEYIINQSNNTDVVKKQLEDKEKNVVNGLLFKPENADNISNTEKAEEFKHFVSTLNAQKKAELYKEIISTPSEEYISQALEQYLQVERAALEQIIIQNYVAETGVSEQEIREYISGLDDETFYETVKEGMTERIKKEYADAVEKQLTGASDEALAAQLDMMLSSPNTTEDTLAYYRDNFMDSFYSETDYEHTLKLIGYIDIEDPASVNLYSATFEDKDKIAEMINTYNSGVAEDDKLSYTDYVKMLMSSITSIIDAISYVLIAFVAISLVVSSIMIGIITYISVLERTKEIGILRSIGASKRDISRVFNAETLIVGLAAGLIGIGSTILLCIPINAIIQHLTQMDTIKAYLPPVAGVVLVLISVLLTVVAGLFPARIASKKDPVEALRTE